VNLAVISGHLLQGSRTGRCAAGRSQTCSPSSAPAPPPMSSGQMGKPVKEKLKMDLMMMLEVKIVMML
jgi:hypothetical protein